MTVASSSNASHTTTNLRVTITFEGDRMLAPRRRNDREHLREMALNKTTISSNERSAKGPMAVILAAACTGSARLSATTGLPLIHLSVTRDSAASLRRMNSSGHGSAVRWQRSFQPLDFEPHWDDWRAVRLEAVRTSAAPLGVHFVDGAIAVPLPDEAVVPEFAAQFSAALRHLRLQEAVIRPSFLEALSALDPLADLVVHPRYTPRAPLDFVDATLVTDIYAFDPVEDAGRLVWLAAAAKLGACEGSRAVWP